MEDQVVAAVDPWQRSKQLIALKRLRIITGMEGRCDDLDYEINKQVKIERERGM